MWPGSHLSLVHPLAHPQKTVPSLLLCPQRATSPPPFFFLNATRASPFRVNHALSSVIRSGMSNRLKLDDWEQSRGRSCQTYGESLSQFTWGWIWDLRGYHADPVEGPSRGRRQSPDGTASATFPQPHPATPGAKLPLASSDRPGHPSMVLWEVPVTWNCRNPNRERR